MKSPAAYSGQYNLKGKKYKLASCGCCILIDFRDSERLKADKKEMRAAFRATSTED